MLSEAFHCLFGCDGELDGADDLINGLFGFDKNPFFLRSFESNAVGHHSIGQQPRVLLSEADLLFL
jgi:hypothetical protein